jgi:hypothetical protein
MANVSVKTKCMSSAHNHLGESLLLEIGNDTLAQEIRRANDMKHLFVIVAQQSKLETVFSRVESDRPGSGRAIETVCRFAFDACQIHRIIKGADDAIVSVVKTLNKKKRRSE